MSARRRRVAIRDRLATAAARKPPLRWHIALVVTCLGVALSAHALDLSAVLLHAADSGGQIAGPVWQTGTGLGGRPLGFTRWPPPGTRGMPFPLGPDGTLRDNTGRLGLPLWPGSHVTHLFWQFLPGEFPSAVVLNLYFNGDLSSPGISVLVSGTYGLTHFVPNPAPYSLSFNLSSATNPASAEFSDGSASARVTAAFFFSSSSSLPEVIQWRPADFVDIDRVGIDRLAPDGLPDGVLIFELIVWPRQQTTGGVRRSTAPLAGFGRPTGDAAIATTVAGPAPPEPEPTPSHAAEAPTFVPSPASSPSPEPQQNDTDSQQTPDTDTDASPAPTSATPEATVHPTVNATARPSVKAASTRPRSTPTPDRTAAALTPSPEASAPGASLPAERSPNPTEAAGSQPRAPRAATP